MTVDFICLILFNVEIIILINRVGGYFGGLNLRKRRVDIILGNNGSVSLSPLFYSFMIQIHSSLYHDIKMNELLSVCSLNYFQHIITSAICNLCSSGYVCYHTLQFTSYAVDYILPWKYFKVQSDVLY
jgi:hypothetical protein